jgi:hypothetical protein
MARQVYHGEDFSYEQRRDDLFYVMARVTNKEQADTWIAIYDTMESKDWYGPLQKEIDKLIPVKKCHNTVPFGANSAGQSTIRDALETFHTERPVDLWIAYVWSSTTTPTYPIRAIDVLNIELIMTVTTAAPYLYTWHMGITRSIIWQYNPAAVQHRHISVNLHCFAAGVMKRRYPSLRYVRSDMAYTMSGQLQKPEALGPYIGTRVFFGDESPIIREQYLGPRGVLDIDVTYRATHVTLYGLPRENGQAPPVIWEGTKAEFVWPRYPGGGANEKFIADIDLLADKDREAAMAQN